MFTGVDFVESASENSVTPSSLEEDLPEVGIIFYSDRFIFRSKNIDDHVIVLFTFERGKQEEGYYGEFLGAVYERNRWSFLEGNEKYLYASTDLDTILPTYYAKVTGSSVSGYVLRYDGGDFTFKISSGPVHKIYEPNKGRTLNRSIGISEAVLTLGGKEYWGDLVHESLTWTGFDGLKRYKGLYKNYQAFYLKTEGGQQVYFHKNSADQQAFLNEHHFSETLQSEGGVIIREQKILHAFKPPIPLSSIKRETPPFAVYTVPNRWELEVSPDFGSLLLWTRKKASINWVLGGYIVIAVEGVIRNGVKEEERIWGFAEYFP